MATLSRREALTVAGGVAAAAAWAAGLDPFAVLTGCTTQDGPRPRAQVDLPAGVTWHKAPCRFCGTGCGVEVAVHDGRLVALRGDEQSPVNRGLLCVKGYMAPQILYGDDRLTEPLLRRGRKLEKVSWDVALATLTHKLQEALARLGPSGVAFYGSGQTTIHEGYVISKLWRAGIGSNEVEANARLCMASAVSGFLTTFGADEPMGCYEDLEKADAFVLWGANMAEMHPVLFSRIAERRRSAAHVRVIDIGTRRTRTTEGADIFVPLQPQGDLALANGILHLLFQKGRVNRAFVEKHCALRKGRTEIGYGLEDRFAFEDAPEPIALADLERFVASYTPARVRELAGVPEAQTEMLAEVYGNPATKVLSLWCMGVNQHVRGTWMNNLIYDLHLVTGKVGRDGSNALSLTGQPSACGTVREVGLACNRLPADLVVTDPAHRKIAAEIWGVPVDRLNPTPGRNTMEMFRAFDRGEVGFLWVQATNPFHTLPNVKRYREAARQQKGFLVVSDVYPTETTALADLVLPSALWVEKEGAYGNTERRTQQWDACVEPPGEARSEVWQLVEVAKRLGHGALFDYGGQALHEALFEEYRRFGQGRGKDLAPYQAYREQHGGFLWPVVEGREVRYRYVEGEDPYVKAGSGLDFYKNKATGGRAVVWARPWEPAAESPDERYPLWLCTGRVLEHWHTGTLTRRVPELHRAVPRAYLEMHPVDAAQQGLRAGQRVRVETRRGTFTATLVIEGGRAQPLRGTIFAPFFDDQILVNEATLDAYCPISKQPDYKKCAARVVPA